MKKIPQIIVFFIAALFTGNVLAITSADIKNDNLAKFILVAYENTFNSIQKSPFTLIVLIGLIVLIIIFLFNYFSYKCPSCKKWRALVKINSELISQREGFKTVTRSDSISTRNSSNSDRGYSHGTIDRKEQVRILEQVYNVTYKCKFCNVISQSKETTETENFFR